MAAISVPNIFPRDTAGLTQQFVATGTYSDGSTQILTTQVTWSSSDTTVATINSNGLATTLQQGTPTITATFNSFSDHVTLTVLPPTLQSISVTPANPTITSGQTQQFTATGIYSNGSTQDLTNQVIWSSSDTTIATINTQGLATASASNSGSSTINAKDPNTQITGSTSLTVENASLVSISVSPTNPNVDAGLTEQFTATGHYSNGSTHDLTNQATWISSDTNAATINANGLATSVAQGSTNISATFDSQTGQTTLTINPPSLVSIAVTPNNPTVAAGLTQQFTAMGTYTDHSTQNLTSSVAWNSSNPSAATISAAGLATTLAQGTSTISATLNSVSGNTLLTVNPPSLVSIAVTPSNPTVAAGLTQQFTATGTYTDNSTQNLTSSVTWNSSNTNAATISTTGLATTLAQGTSTISATLNSISGNTLLTVGSPNLVSIAVTPANQKITSGSTLQFSALGTFSDGSTGAVTVNWSSSVPSFASIDNAGLATGQNSAGTTTITATSTQNPSISGNTTLQVVTLQSIAVTPVSATIQKGNTQQYVAIGTYSDNVTQQNLTSQVTWISSNTVVATINSSGLATGANGGSTTISASLGSVTSNNAGLTVLAPPAPTGMSPTSGPISGHTSVTITGSGFTGTTSVKFGSSSALSFTVVNDGQIQCTTPPHASGPVVVTVTNSVGSGSPPQTFTFF